MLRYVQSKGGVFVRHIFDIAPTQWDENNFCYARKLTPEQAAHFGVTKLQIVTPPYFDPATQRRDEGPAVLSNGVWVQQYIVTALSAEDVAAKAAAQAAQARTERARLLAASDWTQVADAPVDQAAWATYRQALRDVPKQAGFPWTVQWPTQPE
jgi:hypothetical protein